MKARITLIIRLLLSNMYKITVYKKTDNQAPPTGRQHLNYDIVDQYNRKTKKHVDK